MNELELNEENKLVFADSDVEIRTYNDCIFCGNPVVNGFVSVEETDGDWKYVCPPCFLKALKGGYARYVAITNSSEQTVRDENVK